MSRPFASYRSNGIDDALGVGGIFWGEGGNVFFSGIEGWVVGVVDIHGIA